MKARAVRGRHRPPVGTNPYRSGIFTVFSYVSTAGTGLSSRAALAPSSHAISLKEG
jgi:hypothetical protein